MKIERTTVNMIEIIDAPRLDRIKVFTEDFAPGKGQITVVCWGRAWSSYWGGMSDGDVRHFVTAMSAEYIAENLSRGMVSGLKKDQKREFAYLVRIVEAVQESLRRVARNDLHGVALTDASPDWAAA